MAKGKALVVGAEILASMMIGVMLGLLWGTAIMSPAVVRAEAERDRLIEHLADVETHSGPGCVWISATICPPAEARP